MEFQNTREYIPVALLAVHGSEGFEIPYHTVPPGAARSSFRLNIQKKYFIFCKTYYKSKDTKEVETLTTIDIPMSNNHLRYIGINLVIEKGLIDGQYTEYENKYVISILSYIKTYGNRYYLKY